MCNAKAKIIERRFRDVKDHLSRLFETFTGGNVLEKPERLKHVLKNGEIPLDSTFTETVEELLDWYFNQQPYGGEVQGDRGKPRQQVFNENLHKKRVASAEDLNLMLMRSTRTQEVGRLGVSLTIAGYRIDYWNDDFIMQMQGKQRVFADAKEKHSMRYTHHRGLARVSTWVRLKFAAMILIFIRR